MGASLYLTSSLTHFLPRKLQTRSCMVGPACSNLITDARLQSQILRINTTYIRAGKLQIRPMDFRWISDEYPAKNRM